MEFDGSFRQFHPPAGPILTFASRKRQVNRPTKLIPNPSDHDRCAQSRNPSDMMAHGRASSLFHASQQ